MLAQGCTDFAIGDITNDGFPDILSIHNADGEMSKFINNGNDFGIQEMIDGVAQGTSLEDLDNDGLTDVICAGGTSDEITWYKI